MAEPFESVSIADVTDEELASMNAQLVRERAWYAGATRFQDQSDIWRAVQDGDLVRIESNENHHLIRRLRLPDGERPEGLDPFLTPNASILLNLYGSMWRERLESLGIEDPQLRLALSSLVRSQRYQDSIVAKGRLASPDSTHCTGNTWDFDGCAYTRIDPETGRALSIVSPAGLAVRQAAIVKMYGKESTDMTSEGYDEKVVLASYDVAHALQDRGAINLVSEFPGTHSAVLHIAGTPEDAFDFAN